MAHADGELVDHLRGKAAGADGTRACSGGAVRIPWQPPLDDVGGFGGDGDGPKNCNPVDLGSGNAMAFRLRPFGMSVPHAG